ncbi:MAG: hypothetical protein MJZ34_08025 [Paludibacteraceae bacterium]|nr:hypothetical protein [Paludibacteraceae bacterium]
MTKEETFYVISWMEKEFLTDEYRKTKDEKYILKNVRVYRRDMTKLDGYKHTNETQDIFEAQRYKTEQNARTALDRIFGRCLPNFDCKIHCVTIKTEVTSINDVSKE